MTHQELSPEQDFHAWALNAAQRARAGLLTPQELEQVAEELEDMAGGERRELKNRLTVLLGHLLKWQYQPQRRGKSWQLTIKEQRVAVKGVLKDNPSLRPRIFEFGEETCHLRANWLDLETDSRGGIFSGLIENFLEFA
ncbi:protein of unknown function DUF29 [Nitrosococcus halophilus Nc 4]|uniref:DUF29 domain-containing protein n=1 Tax=Nitrosococcus halophilus (strain Nc4) TaxID=472759 RepID=D5BZG6_NITHN|nr:DUF29 domain-containing protein [Nitrosococcus halophilus]ADE16180.1 protein of unknown function DUF29 [Nitrosococcus halophilus Nc 4]